MEILLKRREKNIGSSHKLKRDLLHIFRFYIWLRMGREDLMVNKLGLGGESSLRHVRHPGTRGPLLLHLGDLPLKGLHLVHQEADPDPQEA